MFPFKVYLSAIILGFLTETSPCVARVFSVAMSDRGYFVESNNDTRWKKILIISGFLPLR